MCEPSPVQFLQHPPQSAAAEKQYCTGPPASPKPQAKAGSLSSRGRRGLDS
jgi:hypothetical protein